MSSACGVERVCMSFSTFSRSSRATGTSSAGLALVFLREFSPLAVVKVRSTSPSPFSTSSGCQAVMQEDIKRSCMRCRDGLHEVAHRCRRHFHGQVCMKVNFVLHGNTICFSTRTSACSGSVGPCRWLGRAGPFGPESKHVWESL